MKNGGQKCAELSLCWMMVLFTQSNNSGWFISSRDGESVNKKCWNV